MKVRDVMTADPITVRPETSFKAVVDLLVQRRIGGLPVVEGDGQLVGVVSESDLITHEAYPEEGRGALAVVRALLHGREHQWVRKADAVLARDLMTSRVITATPDEDVHVAARRLLQQGVNRLPVVEDGRLVGIVTRSDLLRPFHREDETIAADVAAIVTDPPHVEAGYDITCTVHDGVVTLRGTARYPDDIDPLEREVAAVAGVVAVIGDVEAGESVPPVPTPPESDSEPEEPAGF